MSEDFLTSAFVKMRTVLRGTASRLLGSEAAADDALQEAFYKLWNRHYALASESDAAALLSRTVRNEAVDTLRSRKRHPADSLEGRDLPEETPEDREDLLRSVKGLIASELTPLQQEIMRRRDCAGESYADIAEDLGMQETAVRMQLSRARKTIRETYRKQQRNHE